MKIFRQFTIRSLRRNRARTLVTIIGIILSVALFTAVTEGAYSGQQYMANYIRETQGSYHAYYEDITPQQTEALARDPEIRDLAWWDEVGYAKVDEESTSRPYLYIVAASENLPDLIPVRLTTGRMPQTDSELILPVNVSTYGTLNVSVGDTLELDVGTRTVDGWKMNQHNPWIEEEQLENAQQKTYTVVGFYERLHYNIEDFSSPGYTALTAGQGTGVRTTFFTLRHPGNIYSFLDRDLQYVLNRELLMMLGVSRNNYMLTTLYALMAILLVLIMFGSVALIYNSFSISVSERTKQFGLLKSIGATRRQILHTVLFEAVYLCAISIPAGLILGCGGIGVTLYLLSDTFRAVVDQNSDIQMRLALTPWALIVPAAIGLLTALISAWIPARRAIRQSAIDAIRQTGDVRIRPRQVKTSKLVGKLFGFEATLASKNFKRNRKKYRVTVVSLFLSIVLFISASAFSMYLMQTVQGTVNDSPFDVHYTMWGEELSTTDADAILAKLSAVDGVTDGAYRRSVGAPLRIDYELTSQNYRQYYSQFRVDDDETSFAPEQTVTVHFVQDTAFLRLLEQYGLDPAVYYNPETPMALLYDHTREWMYDENGAYTLEYNVFDPNRLPAAVDMVQTRNPEGYALTDQYTDEDGELMYLFSRWDEDGTEHTLALPAEQTEITCPLTIGALIPETPYYLDNSLSLIYPYSFAEPVLGEYDSWPVLQYLFLAPNHRQVYDEMLKLLKAEGKDYSNLYDDAASHDGERATITVVRVFSAGFIVLICLIAAANVFNTIYTNITLRRREMAMLKSVGMTQKGFRRSMNYECVLYGCKALLYGLPVSAGVCYLIYRSIAIFDARFTLPWLSVAAAVAGVFAVVFATMLYAMRKLRDDNPIDALRTETL